MSMWRLRARRLCGPKQKHDLLQSFTGTCLSCIAFGPRGLQCVHAISQYGLSIGDSWPFRLASKGSDTRARLCGDRIARPGRYISMEAVSSEQEGRARRYRARFRAEVASRGLTEISALLHSRKFAYNTCIAGASYMHADRNRYIIQPGYCNRPTDCCSSSKSLISACVARRIHAQYARSRRIGMMAESFSLPPSPCQSTLTLPDFLPTG